MQRERHTPETVAKVIRQTGGILSPAAKILGYSRQSLYDYVKRHHLEGVITEAREEFLDEAEDALRKQIQEGNVTAIIFALKYLGKSRGYIDRVAVRTIPGVEETVEAEADADVITINVRGNGTNGHHV
jgi:hypothetical protein